MSQTHTVDLAR